MLSLDQRAEIMERGVRAFTFGVEVKKEMIAAGEMFATRDCPECGGTIDFCVVGKRQHLRMGCRTPTCFMRVFE